MRAASKHIVASAALVMACTRQEPDPAPQAEQPAVAPTSSAPRRLKALYITSNDGTKVQLPRLMDTAFGVECVPKEDGAGSTRCFPTTVPVGPKAFFDSMCQVDAVVAELHQASAIVSSGGGFRLMRIEAPTSDTVFWTLENNECKQHDVAGDQKVFLPAADLTETLAALRFEWMDTP